MKKNEARKKGTAPVKSDGNGVEKSYAAWIADLKRRYRATQIKAAVARRLASTCGQNFRMTLDFHLATSGIVRIFTACIPPYRFCNKLLQNLPQANGAIIHAPTSLNTQSGVIMNPKRLSYLQAGWKFLDLQPPSSPLACIFPSNVIKCTCFSIGVLCT